MQKCTKTSVAPATFLSSLPHQHRLVVDACEIEAIFAEIGKPNTDLGRFEAERGRVVVHYRWRGVSREFTGRKPGSRFGC